MSFEKLGLIPALLKSIEELGYKDPTEIQKRGIPIVMGKHDTFATAMTGTGKTAAFALPILQRLRNTVNLDKYQVRALIVTPTRELAEQIHEDVKAYGKYLKVSSALNVGGRSIVDQAKILEGGIDILITTPGRLIEHLSNGTMNFEAVEFFVLDEADRMLDMGFMKEIKQIYPKLPRRHQSLLFSATYTNKVRKLSKLILHKPQFIQTARQNAANDAVDQFVYFVDLDKKEALLSYLIGSKNYEQVLVFTRTKDRVDGLVKHLERDGLKSAGIHGDKTQAARSKALAAFKEGKVRVLVATDIASRGIDIEALPCVINFELPDVLEDYVHRIGRTARAGKDGVAISLIEVNERRHLKKIEQMIKEKIPSDVMEGFELDPSIRAQDDDDRISKVGYKHKDKKVVVKKHNNNSSSRNDKKRRTTKRGTR